MNTALSLTADYMTMLLMLSKQQFTEKLGRNIKKFREEKGVSQEELADKAGIYRTYIGHIENARYSPSCFILYKIAKILKMLPSDLLPD